MKVLIIEDDPENLRALSQLIRVSWKMPTIPLEIVGVGTLTEGLREAESANVTILDLSLPDSDMVNTLQHIRDFRPPVIVLTGASDDATTTACYLHGATHVFFKGAAIGLIPSIFEALQKDLLRRALDRSSSDLAPAVHEP